MLTTADKALWQHFLDALKMRTPEFEAEDMVPVVLVFARVRGRSDDAAVIGLGLGDISLLARPDVAGYNLAAMLDAAAMVARERGPG